MSEIAAGVDNSSRLHPAAQAVVNSTNQERMAFLDEPFWLNYPAVIPILTRLERILERRPPGRPEGMSIIGDPNNGKTHLLEYFHRKHPTGRVEGNKPPIIPVVRIEAPISGSRGDFFNSLCEAIGIPVVRRGGIAKERGLVMTGLRDASTRILIVDEFHNLQSGSFKQQSELTDELKTISNKLRITLIVAGTSRALQPLKRDNQFLSRMPPVMLPPWQLDKNYLGLLKALEGRLPLREPSFLTERSMAELIFAKSRKTIGHTTSIVLEAGRQALLEGRERIDEVLINRADSMNIPWLKV